MDNKILYQLGPKYFEGSGQKYKFVLLTCGDDVTENMLWNNVHNSGRYYRFIYHMED